MANQPSNPNYSSDALDQLDEQQAAIDADLERILFLVAENTSSLTNARAREYLLNGVGRRLRILRRGINNVFRLFPPSAVEPIETDYLDDALISLHAFVINLYGLLDNLAWAFVWRHGLEKVVPRRQVGMFAEQTQRHLPDPLRTYFGSPKMTRWHNEYLKGYRDALAHRIPLYIPPANYSPNDAKRHEAIERERLDAIRAREWQKVEALREEQDRLGTPSAIFVHSFIGDDRSQPLHLHPQMISDAVTVIEACEVFFRHWNSSSVPGEATPGVASGR